MALKSGFRFAAILLLTSYNSFAQPDYEWAGEYGGTANEYGNDITTDAAGNVYVIGYFEGTVDFDPSAGISNLVSAGGNDIFITKMNATGNLIWARRMGGAGEDYGYSLELDASGNIISTGIYTNTVDFDPGVGIVNLTNPSGIGDGFISKLDNNGNFVWAKSFESSTGSSNSQGNDLNLDAAGDIYISGMFLGTVDFDPGAGTLNFVTPGLYQTFTTKLDISGNLIWAKHIVGTSSVFTIGSALDASGNFYLTGYYSGTIDTDPGAGTVNLTSAGLNDSYIIKLDPSGNFQWSKNIGGTGHDRIYETCIDLAGNLYATGTFQTTVDCDPSPGTANLTSAGGLVDGFVLKLDPNGLYLWSGAISGAQTDHVMTMAVDQSGDVYVTGFYQGTTDFDPSASVSSLTAIGLDDAFIMKWTTNGNFAWTIPIGGTIEESGMGITIDASNNILITGYFSSPVDFDPGVGVANVTPIGAGTYEIFIAKYSQCGSDIVAPLPAISTLANVTSQCSVTSLTAPTATDNCAGTINGTHNATLPITTQGTTIITWTYDDGNGNTITQNQNVIIDDNTNPGADDLTLSDITSQCSVTSLTTPTATDNCTGTINGTHNTTLPITTQGTTIITWTYDDGNGNSITQNQNVIVDDNTNPVADVLTLSDITSQCSVTSLTAPTATDNCSGALTGTHNATLPITASGTTVVTWTYDDGNGNTITQNQNVIITPIDNSVSVNEITLTANASGYTYQWIDCGNGNAPISGETNQNFTATTNGTYAVEISNGTCTVTSACTAITQVGLDENNTAQVMIFPNPFVDQVMIKSSETIQEIQITTNTGQVVQTILVAYENALIELNELAAGIYFIRIKTETEQSVHLLIKE